MLIGGFLVAFIQGWLYSIYLFLVSTIQIFVIMLFIRMESKGAKIKLRNYSKAGAISN